MAFILPQQTLSPYTHLKIWYFFFSGTHLHGPRSSRWSREERLTPGRVSSSKWHLGFVLQRLSAISLSINLDHLNHSQIIIRCWVVIRALNQAGLAHTAGAAWLFQLAPFSPSFWSFKFSSGLLYKTALPPLPHRTPNPSPWRIVTVAAQWGGERMSSPFPC